MRKVNDDGKNHMMSNVKIYRRRVEIRLPLEVGLVGDLKRNTDLSLLSGLK